MRRTLLGFALVAAVIAPAWFRLETAGLPLGPVLVMVALALLPTLAVALGRRPAVVAVVAAASTLVAFSAAFELSLADARPRDPERDFFGPALSSFRQGFLDFYDTRVPFDGTGFPLMHGVVLLAVFGFAAAAGIAIAARRPFAALSALVVGAGWPATMATTWVEGTRPLLTGAVILAAALVLLVLLEPPRRRLGPAVAVGLALVAVSVAGSTSEAVAKRGFVDWASWDFYDRPDDPVDVRYVWDSNYDGIRFPEEETTVLKVKVKGPRRSLYWRATTLDQYTGAVWREDLRPAATVEGDEPIDVAAADPLLPEAARSEEDWVEQEVRVEALEDVHLVGSAQAVRWEADLEGPTQLATNGAVFLDEPLRRGDRYTLWSYVPEARPRELREAEADYPAAADDYLRVVPTDAVESLPAFGTPGRDAFMQRFFATAAYLDPGHASVWDAASEVTAEATSPYEAAVLLEAWFRGTEGGFVYDESPPLSGAEPPLVSFLETKRGYCQHFAGAMALMLRYLGVPARVAAGFTSGSYDEGKREWTVTDHNAHTWVEVYFPGFGWIPFDPTPNRGQLTAAYTPFSGAFDARGAADLGGAILGVPEIRAQIDRAGGLAEGAGGSVGQTGGGAPGTVAETGGSVVGLLLLVLGGAAAAVVLLKEARRRLRFAARDPRALASAYRRDLVGYLADQGYEIPPSATARELGELVQRRYGVDPARFVAALADARYGPPRPARARARAAGAELRRLRGRMSRQLGLVRRIRGAVSIRSLTA
jgi:protein-glutamine gamma-glutamyltransferase